MKYLDEYRNTEIIKQLVTKIAKITTKPHAIMEICGGQTHAIIKYGLDKLLPEAITLLHGPGCPVCVTPIDIIDQAIQISLHKNVIFCSFGDMLRVPGSEESLLVARAKGAKIQIVYSPLDAVKIAANAPDKEVVFFGIGFETTVPANAMAIKMAASMQLKNFSMLISQFLVPPAIAGILSSATNRVQGFLAAGHVCTVMGFAEYEPLCVQYKVPIVVTGFEPVDLLHGIYACIKQLEEGRSTVENQYSRVVNRDGNKLARALITEVFEVVPKEWRGIGIVPNSGLGLRAKYQHFAAENRFACRQRNSNNCNDKCVCISGLILQGAKKPADCPAFGSHCSPDKPLGAPMVSAEGVCAAYYNYRHVVTEEN
jgi:hydrogenase expression/formation protein HypD